MPVLPVREFKSQSMQCCSHHVGALTRSRANAISWEGERRSTFLSPLSSLSPILVSGIDQSIGFLLHSFFSSLSLFSPQGPVSWEPEHFQHGQGLLAVQREALFAVPSARSDDNNIGFRLFFSLTLRAQYSEIEKGSFDFKLDSLGLRKASKYPTKIWYFLSEFGSDIGFVGGRPSMSFRASKVKAGKNHQKEGHVLPASDFPRPKRPNKRDLRERKTSKMANFTNFMNYADARHGIIGLLHKLVDFTVSGSNFAVHRSQ